MKPRGETALDVNTSHHTAKGVCAHMNKVLNNKSDMSRNFVVYLGECISGVGVAITELEQKSKTTGNVIKSAYLLVAESPENMNAMLHELADETHFEVVNGDTQMMVPRYRVEELAMDMAQKFIADLLMGKLIESIPQEVMAKGVN